MVTFVETLRLTGYALGTLGATLFFVETFQFPSYIDYNDEFGSYSIDLNPTEPREYTWLGRIGVLLVAVAFALQFVAVFLG